MTVTDRGPALPDTPLEAQGFVGVRAAATSAGGVSALVLLELLAFLARLCLALGAARRADSRGFYVPPATLAVIGSVATTTNLVLLAG